MSQQTIKQQARRTAREMAQRRRREREERERRVVDLAERVMVAIGERDAAVAETERRVGEALRELTEREGLSLGEAVDWCGETITVREATPLRGSPVSRQQAMTASRAATARSWRPLGTAEDVAPIFLVQPIRCAGQTNSVMIHLAPTVEREHAPLRCTFIREGRQP